MRQSDLPDAATEDTDEVVIAASQIEDHRERVVLLGLGDDEVAQKGLARSGGALNEGVADVLVGADSRSLRRVVVGLDEIARAVASAQVGARAL